MLRRESPRRHLRLPNIVDLKGGGFKLGANPNSSQQRLLRALKWFMALLAFAACAAMIDLALRFPIALHGMNPFVLPSICAAIGLGSWFMLWPPLVQVTAEHVTYRNGIPIRIKRPDLASIFRGLARGRYGWVPAYFFVTDDGTPHFGISAEDFPEESMTELANRLKVPIQGDFTAKVQ